MSAENLKALLFKVSVDGAKALLTKADRFVSGAQSCLADFLSAANEASESEMP